MLQAFNEAVLLHDMWYIKMTTIKIAAVMSSVDLECSFTNIAANVAFNLLIAKPNSRVILICQYGCHDNTSLPLLSDHLSSLSTCEVVVQVRLCNYDVFWR